MGPLSDVHQKSDLPLNDTLLVVQPGEPHGLLSGADQKSETHPIPPLNSFGEGSNAGCCQKPIRSPTHPQITPLQEFSGGVDPHGLLSDANRKSTLPPNHPLLMVQ